MQSTDFRNATFDSIRKNLDGLRLRAYHGWLLHGPGTTREVSQRCGMDILTFRPRTTELMALGLVTLDDRQHEKGEGVYRAARKEQWEAFAENQAAGQLTLI